MAKQLRRPSGVMGDKVGNMMNKANEFLYDFTLGVMNLSDNQTILEIGFGNGKFFEKIFSRANNLQVTGLDFSETMFSQATEKNTEAIANGKLKLQLGNSDNLPFPDNSFDKIFCINVIYFWDNPKKHLLEIQRVLKPGGRFYATVRTKESMLKMPFTKYGFSFYDTENWKMQLDKCCLTFVEEYQVDEPVVDLKGMNLDEDKIVVQSICTISEKKN